MNLRRILAVAALAAAFSGCASIEPRPPRLNAVYCASTAGEFQRCGSFVSLVSSPVDPIASLRADAIRGGAVPLTQVDEDVVNRGRVGDEGDDAHRGAIQRARQWEHFIDASHQQRPGVADGAPPLRGQTLQ